MGSVGTPSVGSSVATRHSGCSELSGSREKRESALCDSGYSELDVCSCIAVHTATAECNNAHCALREYSNAQCGVWECNHLNCPVEVGSKLQCSVREDSHIQQQHSVGEGSEKQC